MHVVLVNQSDLPNGWATPVPYNLIEISAAGPDGESTIANTDDWLRLVFTHEYTHIVHLGRSPGWIGGLHRAFGRNPALFPNLALPLWAIEGMATFEESAQTGHGRVNAGDFRQIVGRAACGVPIRAARSRRRRTRRVARRQRAVRGRQVFHRFSPTVRGGHAAALTNETGSAAVLRAPAFRRVFGRSLGGLWSDFEGEMRQREQAEPAIASRLTHHGFTVSGPRFARMVESTTRPSIPTVFRR